MSEWLGCLRYKLTDFLTAAFAFFLLLLMKCSTYSRLCACRHQLGAWLYGAYAWGLFILIFLTAGTLISVFQRPSIGRQIAHAACRMLYFLGGISLKLEGKERLPARSHILLVNHSSFVDGIALSALLPPFPGYSFVVRQQYTRQALFYPLLKGLDTLILERRPHHSESHPNLEKMATALHNGTQLIIFPEGEFRADPGLLPFHSGVFITSLRTGVPLTPAILRGAREQLRPGTWLPRHSRLHLTIGPTLFPDTDAAMTPELMECHALTIMKAMLNDLPGE